tara:strand:- start:1341 stop:1532 length:192 start_codon:yes stop_codon:yes gene_type:complete
MSDTIDFTFIDGWVLKADADEENKVFHVTIINNDGDITDSVGNSRKEHKLSFALVQEDKDEEV